MLGSLRSKYRHLFISADEYHDKGIILSDDVLLNLESGITTIPIPSIIPYFTTGEKIGEGLTSETFTCLEKLAPFPLVVQYHPITLEETQHLVCVSSLLSQLYALSPHIILFLGYYFAPGDKELSSPQESYYQDEYTTLSEYSSSESGHPMLSYDCYALLYEYVPLTLDRVYKHIKADPILCRNILAQLFFTLELLRRFGFNHGDINLGNLGWDNEPVWQGRDLLNYNYYAYIIDSTTYYIPSGPLLRLLDFNLTSYEDGTLTLTSDNSYQDDFASALSLAQNLLPSQDFLCKDKTIAWDLLFSQILPQPGDKVIVLGRLPEISSDE